MFPVKYINVHLITKVCGNIFVTGSEALVTHGIASNNYPHRSYA